MKPLVIRSALAVLFCLQLGGAQAQSFTIAAASELRFALDEIIELFQERHPEHEVRVIYGSSGKMTTQIMHGAPFDLFLSADIAFPERLQATGMTAGEPKAYALGSIVLWSSSLDASELTLVDLATDERIRRIAIAQPTHAPNGLRAQQALQAAGVWDAVQPKLVFGENISHATQMVESGAASVGIIARSLAVSPRLAEHPYHLIDPGLYEPLVQALVITRRGADRPGLHAFVEFMTGEQALAVLRRFGFTIPGDEQPIASDQIETEQAETD